MTECTISLGTYINKSTLTKNLCVYISSIPGIKEGEFKRGKIVLLKDKKIKIQFTKIKSKGTATIRGAHQQSAHLRCGRTSTNFDFTSHHIDYHDFPLEGVFKNGTWKSHTAIPSVFLEGKSENNNTKSLMGLIATKRPASGVISINVPADPFIDLPDKFVAIKSGKKTSLIFDPEGTKRLMKQDGQKMIWLDTEEFPDIDNQNTEVDCIFDKNESNILHIYPSGLSLDKDEAEMNDSVKETTLKEVSSRSQTRKPSQNSKGVISETPPLQEQLKADIAEINSLIVEFYEKCNRNNCEAELIVKDDNTISFSITQKTSFVL